MPNTTIRLALRKRKQAVSQLIEAQRERFQVAGKSLLRSTSTIRGPSDNYDVVVTLTTKGLEILEPLCTLLADRLPQLQFERPTASPGHQVALHVAANTDCLLETAALIGIKPLAGKLTSQQRQTIVRHYLDSLRSPRVNSSNVQLPGVKFAEGEAIFSRLLKQNLVDQIFPLHHAGDLGELRRTWVKAVFRPQPLDQVRTYFGPKIAMYFAFLGHYTKMLLIPACCGILVTCVTHATELTWATDLASVLFTIANIAWATQYLASLRTMCSELTSKWDASENCESELNLNLAPRPQCRGEFVIDDVSGLPRIIYPDWKRKAFRYCVTLPTVAISLITVFIIMFRVLSFQTFWDEVLISQRNFPDWTSFVPKVILACIITLMDEIYYRIAVWLNNQENYPFEGEHENHLVSKLVLFQFVNSFLSLFYIAFYEGQMCKLQEQLAALLITRQVIGNIKEALWPLAAHVLKLSPSLPAKPEDAELSQAEIEAALERYESTFDDHLEMFIQFGHVTLFSPIFPLASLCALLNNVVEVRSDAFKLCVCLQRPFAGQKVRDMGEWHTAYNGLLYAAIVVNCGLMVMSGQLARLLPFLDPVHVILVGVLLEHALIGMKLIIERKGSVPFFGRLFCGYAANSVVNYANVSIDKTE